MWFGCSDSGGYTLLNILQCFLYGWYLSLLDFIPRRRRRYQTISASVSVHLLYHIFSYSLAMFSVILVFSTRLQPFRQPSLSMSHQNTSFATHERKNTCVEHIKYGELQYLLPFLNWIIEESYLNIPALLQLFQDNMTLTQHTEYLVSVWIPLHDYYYMPKNISLENTLHSFRCETLCEKGQIDS